mmetsp:Transcript_37353/g.94220  ORF Transcript_37353/g.94220 Transcript_37353/m.94220 type:complete len:280 (+) Transcript_37353:417-1256(+)
MIRSDPRSKISDLIWPDLRSDLRSPRVARHERVHVGGRKLAGIHGVHCTNQRLVVHLALGHLVALQRGQLGARLGRHLRRLRAPALGHLDAPRLDVALHVAARVALGVQRRHLDALAAEGQPHLVLLGEHLVGQQHLEPLLLPRGQVGAGQRALRALAVRLTQVLRHRLPEAVLQRVLLLQRQVLLPLLQPPLALRAPALHPVRRRLGRLGHVWLDDLVNQVVRQRVLGAHVQRPLHVRVQLLHGPPRADGQHAQQLALVVEHLPPLDVNLNSLALTRG